MTAVRHRFDDNLFKSFFKETVHTVRKFIMATKQQVGLGGGKETADTVQKPSIVLTALNLIHRFLSLCVRFVLVKVHGEHGPSMAPIDDLLLLESATSIAEKIRTKKVSIALYFVFPVSSSGYFYLITIPKFIKKCVHRMWTQ